MYCYSDDTLMKFFLITQYLSFCQNINKMDLIPYTKCTNVRKSSLPSNDKIRIHLAANPINDSLSSHKINQLHKLKYVGRMIVRDIIFTNFPCHLQLLLLSSRDKFIYENETLFRMTCNANHSNFLKSDHTEAVIHMTCERIKCRKMNFQQIPNDSSSFDKIVGVI